LVYISKHEVGLFFFYPRKIYERPAKLQPEAELAIMSTRDEKREAFDHYGELLVTAQIRKELELLVRLLRD